MLRRVAGAAAVGAAGLWAADVTANDDWDEYTAIAGRAPAPPAGVAKRKVSS